MKIDKKNNSFIHKDFFFLYQGNDIITDSNTNS